MDQLVSHPGNILPWDVRVPCPDWIRYMFCSFSDDFNTLDRGKIGFLIVSECFKRETMSEAGYPADVIDDILQV